ncbi:MAG: hypothetical protein SGI73_01725 [Chloroflexota bacterium]|nr:hypothetical protein [Chloroflexota bacterium]
MDRPFDIPDHDLPLWMRRARRGVDWGVLLSLAFSLLAAWMFVSQADLPNTYNGEHTVYQTATFATAIAEGRLYPRWIPDALGGYGAPIPHYYPPGGALMTAFVQFFITGDVVSAIRLVMIALTMLAGASVYALAARHWGGAGGVLASVLFLFNPIIGMTLPGVVGDLPTFAGVAYTAALLWSIDRMLIDRRPLDGLAAALSTAALLLTHIGTGIAALALAAGYLIAFAVRQRGGAHILAIAFGVVVRLVVGIGIAACFWLPAALEQNAVNWLPREATITPMLTLNGLIAAPRPIDPGELLPLPEWGLGVALLLCALLSFAALIALRARLPTGARFSIYFLAWGAALIAIGVGFMPSQPWLTGLIALCLAFAGGGALAWRDYPRIHPRLRRLIMPLLCTVTLAFALPLWLSPPVTARMGDVSARAQVEYERLGFGIAALPADAPIPSTLNDAPLNRALLAGYESGVISKISSENANARIGLLAHGTHSDAFQISVGGTTTFDVLTASFPGWTATLNDQLLPLTRTAVGLMEISINTPSSGTLIIRLDTTPIRAAAWIITWGMVIIAAMLTIRSAQYIQADPHMGAFEPLTNFETRLISAAFIVFAFAVAIAPLAALQRGVPLHPASGYRIQDATPIRARTNDGLEVLGFRLEQIAYRAGDPFDLTLIWRTARFLPENNRARLLLLSRADGTLYPLTEPRHPGGVPTRRWATGRYVTDPIAIHLPADLPPGEYSPAIDVLLCAPICTEDARPFFFAADGSPLGFDVVLPIIIRIAES